MYNGREGIVDFSKLELVSAVYRFSRWRKFLSNLEEHSYENRAQFLALNYSRYLCRLWNTDAQPDKRLSTFEIIFVVERTMPPGQAKQRTQRLV